MRQLMSSNMYQALVKGARTNVLLHRSREICKYGRRFVQQSASEGRIEAADDKHDSKAVAKATHKADNKGIVHENGLYYGKFTTEEYEEARKYVTTQYKQLEDSIKGDRDVRSNIGKMPQFPAREKARKKIRNLLDFFQETIKTTGPISLSAYMRQCLTHPTFGYYTTRNPLDTGVGDFITSPEISAVFGEMVGIWLYTLWLKQGTPASVNIVEFGPGKGTLIHDVIQVFHKFAQKSAQPVKIKMIMIEASPVLRKEQWRLLCNSDEPFQQNEAGFNTSTSKWGDNIVWVDTEKDIIARKGECNYILAHEFFDALPIKSFSKTENGWRELMVEHTSSVVNTQGQLPSAEEASDNPTRYDLNTEFHLTTSIKETPSSNIPKLSDRYKSLPVGSRIEVCPDAELYMKKITNLVASGPLASGGALIIDYGLSNEIPLNSLRGIHKHKFVSPFFSPGEVDLSIDVDFQNLKLLAEPEVACFGAVQQGAWLHTMGAGYRFDQLIKSANLIANKELIYKSYLRLTADDEMGKIYKFLALLPKGSTPPVGFGGSA